MATRVDYLMLCTTESDPRTIIKSALTDAHTNAEYDLPDEDILLQMFQIRYINQRKDESVIIAFTIDVEIDPESSRLFVTELSDSLTGQKSAGILHLVKLFDSNLLHRNMQCVKEIFEIEMKLREAFTAIFLHTEPDDVSILLQDTVVKYAGNEKLTSEMLGKAYENDLFYIGFGGYASCNQSKPANDPKTFVEIVTRAADFDELRRRLTQLPITNLSDTTFIASLQTRMDAIEKVRNCVAHNRTIDDKLHADYEKAKEGLLDTINHFLTNRPPIAPNGGEAQPTTV